MSRRWKREGPNHIRCAPWIICSVVVGGGEVFILSRDVVDTAVGRGKDLGELQQLARDIEAKESK